MKGVHILTRQFLSPSRLNNSFMIIYSFIMFYVRFGFLVRCVIPGVFNFILKLLLYGETCKSFCMFSHGVFASGATV
ncbi:hypothetical protein HanRHA438_Chr15g0690701 [Helianthus annuus]|nr:hypothetical protein HanRHA438_Chr15g0690701 [Helianthus annuus]